MHKFIYENDYEQQLNTKVEFNIPSDADLTDMLEEFQNYLKAIGFCFDGNVDIVPEHSMELDPDKRDWQYDCEGNKVVKGDFTTLYKPKKKLWDATPEEWNNAYKNVKVTYK